MVTIVPSKLVGQMFKSGTNRALCTRAIASASTLSHPKHNFNNTSGTSLGNSRRQYSIASQYRWRQLRLKESFLASSLMPMSTSSGNADGDDQFANFLKSEVADEKKEASEIPSMPGFTVETSGPNVKLIKKIKEQTVTVEFSVSNSVSQPEEMGEEATEENPPPVPQMVSLPPFTVTIKKEGFAKAISMRCEFIDQSLMDNDATEGEEVDDKFQIVELAMIDNDSVWTENSYSVNGDVMDANMYDMLMVMLGSRGIDHENFSDQLVKFCSAYENHLYIGMVESMQDFFGK